MINNRFTENVQAETEKVRDDYSGNYVQTKSGEDEELTGNDDDEKLCPICDNWFMSLDMLENHMNTHREIVQLDGNDNDEYDEYRFQNEYERRDPKTEAPYFFSDEDLEDFAVECKVCGKEFEGKSLYNTHVDSYHPCKTCQQYNGGDIHHCPYRDFLLP